MAQEFPLPDDHAAIASSSDAAILKAECGRFARLGVDTYEVDHSSDAAERMRIIGGLCRITTLGQTIRKTLPVKHAGTSLLSTGTVVHAVLIQFSARIEV